MFDSGIIAKELIDEVKSEADIAPDIMEQHFISWINTLEQQLYSEIIREQKEGLVSVQDTSDYFGEISLDSFNNSDEDKVRFEDIYAVYAANKQLIKTTLTSGTLFSDCYFKKDNELHINVSGKLDGNIRVIYFVRPKPKLLTQYSSQSIMLPVEFIDLLKAFIRSEAYKLANEDALCAKWTAEYNTLLEIFKVWVTDKLPQFGI